MEQKTNPSGQQTATKKKEPTAWLKEVSELSSSIGEQLNEKTGKPFAPHIAHAAQMLAKEADTIVIHAGDFDEVDQEQGQSQEGKADGE